MSKNIIWGLFGIVAIIALLLGFRVLIHAGLFLQVGDAVDTRVQEELDVALKERQAS